MSSLIPLLIALAVLALIAFIVLIVRAGRRKARQRTEALERVCYEMGFTFEAVGDLDMLKTLGDLPLYRRGHSIRARNMMSGRVGDDEVKVLDFRYTTGGGEHQQTVVQTVAVFPRGARGLPDLQLAPENVFHRIGQVFGYQDIDFESDPEFSKRYLVRGPDETAIRAALHADALSFFAEHEGWTVEVRSETVGTYRAGKRCAAEGIPTFLDEAYTILRHLRRA
ncbi:MAG TPA: hypothetical protein VF332_05410 [Vicinamibacterales bacterium]